jgi:hypothetical protein
MKLVVFVVLAIASMSTSRASDGPLPEFQIDLVVKHSGIEAICLAGCNWKELSADFPGQRYYLSREGVFPATNADVLGENPGFAILVERAAEGVKLSCSEGCAWVTAQAKSVANRVRVTQEGVLPRQ